MQEAAYSLNARHLMAGWDGSMPFPVFQAFYHQLVDDLKREKEAREKAALASKTKAGFKRR